MDNGLDHITENQKIKVDQLRSEIHHTPIVSSKSIAYIPIGHGAEDTSREIEVPEGCVLVVKGHAGYTTKDDEFKHNLLELLEKKNRSILFNPNNNKKELFTLVTDRGNHTVAIYNEKDKVHNFIYSLLDCSHIFIGNSGILKVDSEYTVPKDINKNTPIRNFNVAAFSLNNSVYSINTIDGLNIYDYFTYSNIYPYYYTRQHIKDIMDAVTEIINNLENLKLDRSDFNKRYAKIEKGLDSPDILSLYINYLQKYVQVPEDNIETSSFLKIIDNFTLYNILSFINSRTKTNQSALFDDVKNGIIQPGVFYNLICRATENTEITGEGLLKRNVNSQGKEIFSVHNMKEEIKGNIIEAEGHRKNQVKQVEESMKEKNSNHFTLNVNNTSGGDIREYIYILKQEVLNTQEYTNSKKYNDKQISNLDELPMVKADVYKALIQEKKHLIEELKEYDLNRPSIEISETLISILKKKKDRLDIIEKILEKHFKGFVPLVRRQSKTTPFESSNYKKYQKNTKNANSYTYKKGANGKWQRYKKGFFYNTKNTGKRVNQSRGVIKATQNNTNYVKNTNGKWKTRKWNNVAQKYVEENAYNTVYKNNLTRKNPKWTKMTTGDSVGN